jgi:nucleotide-binding universal stress UspA family protein
VTPSLERIVVGVDGSDAGTESLQWSILLAQRFEAELIVVHAVGLLDHLEVGRPVPRHSHLDDIRRAFEDAWCAPLSGSGVRHRELLLDGSAVPVLLGVAERESADIIVVGSRGVGGDVELLLGSTSLQVAKEAGRPVFIVHPVQPDDGTYP